MTTFPNATGYLEENQLQWGRCWLQRMTNGPHGVYLDQGTLQWGRCWLQRMTLVNQLQEIEANSPLQWGRCWLQRMTGPVAETVTPKHVASMGPLLVTADAKYAVNQATTPLVASMGPLLVTADDRAIASGSVNTSAGFNGAAVGYSG